MIRNNFETIITILICFCRSLDNIEASYEIKLPGYQLDRADETWRKFAFKIHNSTQVLYFAAEDRAELVKWLNVLAKEMNKEKFLAIKDPDVRNRLKIIISTNKFLNTFIK